VLELIPLFENEALWDLVESSRALLASLREMDVPAAWRVFCGMDLAGSAGPIDSMRLREKINERFALLGALLGSMTVAERY
jgi:hypothetical protein